MSAIFDFFSGLGNEFALFMISLIPLIEERGAIIYGATIGMPWYEVLPICIIGNMVPVPFILLFGMKLIAYLKTTKLFGSFFHKYENKLMEKSQTIDRYSFLALVLFVGIPLPGTGAWSGSLIATILNVKFKRAFVAVFLGVILAGVIMTLGSYGVVGIFRLFI
ncbi:MAG: small multi-drug export protein [Erysipelotrichaceae bacterium]|nr:small multi-drug export protein [Erysipelotrichaceae bacterium]MDD3923928.1 small multi-drug export protein [Erysipelotrichaceae bacterium]MDD4642695.1 small multi-drug export protein [Erysipelotrichaceae bacterium]